MNKCFKVPNQSGAKTKHNFSTNLLTAINTVDDTIITCFPGIYARPFPRADLSLLGTKKQKFFAKHMHLLIWGEH
jgi:hypothetical protein